MGTRTEGGGKEVIGGGNGGNGRVMELLRSMWGWRTGYLRLRLEGV